MLEEGLRKTGKGRSAKFGKEEHVFLQRTKDRRQKNNCDAKGECKEMFPTFAMI